MPSHSSQQPTDESAQVTEEYTDSNTVILDMLASYLSDGKRVSLYDLVKWLQQPEQAIFNGDSLKDPLLLFRCNFLLMHNLYRLQEHWRNNKTGELHISALDIFLLPAEQHLIQNKEKAETEAASVATSDPLKSYYLDLKNLATSREEVEALLDQFWQKMRLPDYSQHTNDDLAQLQLTPPVTASQIRLQYRRLAMQHHPDRGGDSHRFRLISAAFQRLKQTSYFS